MDTAGVKPEVLAHPMNQQAARAAWKKLGTRSPMFKTWFGDWEANPVSASKAVDAQGKPQVLYHGSPALAGGKGFDAFNVPKDAGDLLAGTGVYLTDNKKLGQTYTLNRDAALSGAPMGVDNVPDSTPVMPLYANIRNPFAAGAAGMDDVRSILAKELPDEEFGRGPQAAREKADTIDAAIQGLESTYGKDHPLLAYHALKSVLADFGQIDRYATQGDPAREVLERHGFDGIRHEGGVQGGGKHGVWIAFRPEQLKSAEPAGSARSNSGAFSPRGSSVLAAAEPEPLGSPGRREPRETRVPVSQEVFNRLGVKKGNVFADYAALAGKHPELFQNGHEAKAYVEHVMEKPTEILPGNQADHRLIVRSNGDHKAVALEVELRGGKYRVKSAHTLTDQQLASKRIAAGPGATLGVSRVDSEASQKTPSRLLDASRNAPPDGGGKSTTPPATEQGTKRGSTQLTLSPEDARPIQNYVRAIPNDILYSERNEAGKEKYGRELEPHVTALYGLTGSDDTPDAVRGAVAGHGPVKFKLGRLSLFSDPSKPYDVLKADVESPGLHALNGKLRGLEHQSDYPDYKPHMTLAFLKKGEGARYVDRNPFQGKEFSLSNLTHSSASLERTEIPLDAPAQGSGASTRLAAAEPEAFMDDESESDEPAAPTSKGNFIQRTRAEIAKHGQRTKLEDTLSGRFDAVDTMANIDARHTHSSIALDFDKALNNTVQPLDRKAAGPVVEAGYNPKKLAEDLAKVKASPNKKLAAKYTPIYQYALDNLPRLRDAAKGWRETKAEADRRAEAAGLPPNIQARIERQFDDPLSPEATIFPDNGF